MRRPAAPSGQSSDQARSLLSLMARRLALSAAVLGMAILLGTCTDGENPSPTELPSGRVTARMALAPVIDPSLDTESAAAVNRIRLVAYLAGTDSILGDTLVVVDPNASEWTLDLEILVPDTPGAQVVVTVELINFSGGVETVEWSGQTDPFSVTPGAEPTPQTVPVIRGPLDNVGVTSVTIDEPIADIMVGESVAVTATVTSDDPNATPLIFWSSADGSGIIDISPTGLLTGIAPGTATIVATAGSHTDQATVTVIPRIAGVALSPPEGLLRSLGEEIRFEAQVVDVNGTPIPGEGVRWEVENNGVLQTTAEPGLFRAVARGTTVVTATSVSDPTATAAATVIVQQAVAFVEVTSGTNTVNSVDDRVPFQAQALDAMGNLIPEVTFDWSTSDETIATVDESGVARGHSAGTVLIYAAADPTVVGPASQGAEGTSGIEEAGSGETGSTSGAGAEGGTPEPTPTPGTVGEATLVVNLGLDLEVEKRVSNDMPVEGETFTYAILLTNHGPSIAHNVVLSDQLPGGVAYVSHESLGSYIPSTGLWSVPELRAGETGVLTITVRALPRTANHEIVNTAAVVSVDEDDGNPANDSDSAIIRPQGIDIVLLKSVDNEEPGEGSTVVFTITATNYGPGDATSVVVGDQIPQGLRFVGSRATKGSYDVATGVWTIGDLAEGGSATLELEAKVEFGTVGETIINQAFLSGSNPTDSHPEDNQAQAALSVMGVDIAVEKDVDDHTPAEGHQIVYKIKVENWSSVDGTGIEVEDLLPAGVTYVSHTVTSGSYDHGTGVWEIPSQLPGQSDTLRIVVTVNAGTVDQPITNPAALGHVDQMDIDPSNDSYEIDIDPEGVDIAVYKDADIYDPGEGAQVTYTVKAENYGPKDATNVVIEDVLPAGVTLVTNSTTAGPFDNVTGIWEIPSLPAGAFETLTITVTVDNATAGSTITNAANLTGVDQTDGDPANNGGSVDIFPQGVDIAVYKDADDYTPPEGAQVVYSVKAENYGPADATSVTVQDNLPGGVSYVSHSASAGSWDSGTGVWSLPSVPAGTSETLDITVTVNNATAGSTITNAANLTGVDQTDGDPANNGGFVDIDPQGADIEVTKTVDNPTPAEGEEITYTVTVTNLGPANATNIVVRDTIPTDLTLTGTNVSAGTWDSGTEMWTIPTLAAGASATLTITAQVGLGLAGQSRQNEAQLMSVDQTELNPPNDVGLAQITIQGVDIEVTKTVGIATPTEGSVVTYTVTATNWGPGNAHGVTILDNLPTGVTYSGHNASVGTDYIPGTGIWTIPDIPNGSSLTLTIDATVDIGTGGTTVTNQAELTAVSQTDTNGANDLAQVDIMPQGLDIEVQKTVDNLTPSEGSTITYTVVVTNLGPSEALDAKVTDLLPAGVQYTGHLLTQGVYTSGTGEWSLPALMTVGQSDTLWITATVDNGTAGTTITNQASLTSVQQTDQNAANDMAQVDITPQGLDIEVTKTVDNAIPGEGQAVVYTVTANNLGPADATGITVLDNLPTGVTLTGHTAEPGTTYDTGTGVWSIGALANGASATLTINATVDAGTAGSTITNQAALTAVDQSDENAANDVAQVPIDPLSAPAPRAYTTPGNTELIAGGYTPPTTPYVPVATNLLDGTPDLTVTSTGTFATTNGGSVTVEADGDFSYTPAAGDAGPDTFDYTVQTGASATVTMTIEDMVWYVDNSSPTLPGTGVANDPFETLAEAEGAIPALPPPGPPETVIFLHEGNSGVTPYTGGVTLDSNVRLQGEAAGLDLSSFPGLVAAGGTPVIGGTGDGVVLGSGSTVRGVDIVDPTGAGIYASGINGATVDQVNISGTVASGISLNTTTGTINFTNVTVTDADNTGLYVNGGNPTVSFDGSLVQNSANGHLYMFQVLNTTGGSVTLNTGPFSDTDAASPAIFIDGAGGPVSVNMPVTIVSTADAGVTVQNSAGVVTFADLDIDNGPQIGAHGLRLDNNGSTVNVTNLDVITTGGIGVYVTGNTGGVNISGGTVDATDGAGLFVQNTVFNGTFSSVTVANNAGGVGQGIYLDNTTPGTTSIDYLDAQVNVTGGAVYLNGAGTFQVTDPTSNLGGTNVPVFQAINTDLNVVLDGAGSSAPTSGSGVFHGLYFSGATGTFSAGSTGSITNPGNTGSAGLYVNGGSADITYKGAISNTNANAWSVYAQGRTGGTLTLGGAITDSGRGVAIQSNTGGSVVFNGGLDLTGRGNGGVAPFYTYGAASNGQVEVWDTKEDMATPVTSTIAPASPSLDGTPGLQIINTTIGPNGVTFRSISSTGATGVSLNGIELTNTGAGSFTITGDGATASSGGSLTNIEGNRSTTGHGIVLTNVQDVSLSYMDLDFLHGHGVSGNSVTGFKFLNSTLAHTGEPGQEWQADGLSFEGLSGTVLVQNSTIQYTGEDCIQVHYSSGTLGIDLDGSTLAYCGSSDFNPGHGVNLVENAATTTLDLINGSTIQRAEMDGINADVSGTADVGIKVDATGGQNTFDSNSNNAIEGRVYGSGSLDVQALGGGGNQNLFNLNSFPIVVKQSDDAKVTFNIDGNTFTSGFTLGEFLADETTSASATMDGQFINNTATSVGNGYSNPLVKVEVNGDAQGKVRIDGNTITSTGSSGNGIVGGVGTGGTSGSPILDLNVTNNSVDLGGFNASGTSISLGTGLNGTLCTNVDGNTIAAAGYYDVEISRGGTGDQISLENQSGTGSAFTDSFVSTTYLPGQNPGADNNWVTTNTDQIQKVAPGTCGTPVLPSPPGPSGPGG